MREDDYTAVAKGVRYVLLCVVAIGGSGIIVGLSWAWFLLWLGITDQFLVGFGSTMVGVLVGGIVWNRIIVETRRVEAARSSGAIEALREEVRCADLELEEKDANPAAAIAEIRSHAGGVIATGGQAPPLDLALPPAIAKCLIKFRTGKVIYAHYDKLGDKRLQVAAWAPVSSEGFTEVGTEGLPPDTERGDYYVICMEDGPWFLARRTFHAWVTVDGHGDVISDDDFRVVAYKKVEEKDWRKL